MRDREGDSPAFGDVATAFDANGDELRRALAVADDRLREFDGDASSASRNAATRGSPASRNGGIVPGRVADEHEAVVGRRVAVDRDALNETSAASRARRPQQRGSTGASVATKPSIVAMLGWIIPAPLLMPVTVTSTPSSVDAARRALGTVSVVMIASAALQPAVRRAASAQRLRQAASMRSTGSGSMITPVENGSTCCGSQPSSRASAAHVARARRGPARRCRRSRCRC